MPNLRSVDMIPPNYVVDAVEPDWIHVYPLYGRRHVCEGLTCWCQPEHDAENPKILVHHQEQ